MAEEDKPLEEVVVTGDGSSGTVGWVDDGLGVDGDATFSTGSDPFGGGDMPSIDEGDGPETIGSDVDECGTGTIPVYVEGESGSRGCYLPSEDWITQYIHPSGTYATIPLGDPTVSLLDSYDEHKWLQDFIDVFRSFEGQDTDDIDRIYREEEAQDFKGLLVRIYAGEATWRDLNKEDYEFLGDIPEFSDYFDGVYNQAQYDGMLDDWRTAVGSGDEEQIQGFIEEYENAGISDNPLVQENLASTGSAVSVVTGTVDNSILQDMIRKAAIGDGILGGEVDFEDLPGYGGIWEGLIRHIKVIGKGLPLPIPDWLPLPGIFELPTIGEIFDTVTGPWKTAAEDALKNCMAGPDGVTGVNPDTGQNDDKLASVCLEEQSVIDILVDGIGNATGQIWDKTTETVQGILDETIDCVADPATCAQKVFDKLKDIFGDASVDPTATGGVIPDWMKVIIIGGAYGEEILGQLEDLFGGDIDDNGTIGIETTDYECWDGSIVDDPAKCPEEPPESFDCTTIGKINPEGGATSEADCLEPDPPWEDTGPSPQDCASQNREHVPGDTATETPSSCGGCLTGFEEIGNECQEEPDPVTNNGPTPQECADQNRAYNPPTDVEDSSCGDCLSGFIDSEDGCVEDPGPQDCANGAVDPGTCAECPDKTTPDQHQGGDCRNELIDTTDPFDCADGKPEGYTFATQRWVRECEADYCTDGTPKKTVDGVYGANCADYVAPVKTCAEQGLIEDPNDQTCLTQEQFCARYPNDEACVGPENPCDDPQYAANNPLECGGDPEPEEECAKPDGTPTGATVSSGCEQCPDGYTFDFDGICQPDGGSIDCAQYNRETNDDGTCGGCLPGFQKDTSLPNEPCVKIFDGCPAGFELVNGECVPVTCPEGQSYCPDTDQCEPEGTCPSDEEEGGDSGGSSSGGSGGAFGVEIDLPKAGVAGDPRLLGRKRYGAQDFLTPLFSEYTGGSQQFPIASFLLGNRKKDNFS